MTCKSNCACLDDQISKQVETPDTQEFREAVRSYLHVIESDLAAEHRAGITWENYDTAEVLGLVVGELSIAMDLATRRGRLSDDWEEELGRSIREAAGSAVLALMALGEDLKPLSKIKR